MTNVTSLLKTVKVVEDEHNRGTRALEATVEALAQEMRAFDSNEPPKNKVRATAVIDRDLGADCDCRFATLI